MILMYGIAASILFILAIPIYRQAHANISSLKKASSITEKFMSVLAIVTYLGAVLCWIFLVYFTFSSWQISIDPTKPKPFFLIIYILGLFSLGIVFALSEFFLGLSSLKKSTKNISHNSDSYIE